MNSINDFLDGELEIYVKIYFISIFSLFFRHDFRICVDFTRIAASNTASDDVAYFLGPPCIIQDVTM